jgi:hypothetical protein
MKKIITIILLSPFFTSAQMVQWNQGGDNVSTGNLSVSAITSSSNFFTFAPSGDAVIKRATPGNLMLSSGGGTSEIRFNYNYGGGSGGVLLFDGGVSNYAGLKVNAGGNLNIFSSGGKIGIGTAAPVDQFEVIDGNRKVGLNSAIPGVAAPGGILSLSRPDDGSRIMFMGGSAAPSDDQVIFGSGGSTEMRLVSGGGIAGSIGFYTNETITNAFASDRPSLPVMKITGSGNVGIGTSVPDAKLAVKGTIHTQEVLVDLSGAVAPDYVFEKDYDLLSLSELEAYINQNKHLPEVPSAKEMEMKGLNLKEMNLLLLKKVEELTLYLVEQNRRINKLEKENNEFRELVQERHK